MVYHSRCDSRMIHEVTLPLLRAMERIGAIESYRLIFSSRVETLCPETSGSTFTHRVFNQVVVSINTPVTTKLKGTYSSEFEYSVLYQSFNMCYIR
jgi:hypothetical protein